MADPTASELKLLLHFDGADASTTFTDSSDNAHSGTANGDAQIDISQSKFGGASGLFDGSGDYVSFPASSDFDVGLGDYTAELWFRPATPSIDSFLCGRVASSGMFPGFYFKYLTTNKLVYALDGGKFILGTLTAAANTWHHIALVRDGNTFRAFLNGADDGTLAISGTVFDHNGPFSVGRFGDFITNTFDGHIDDLRLSQGVALYTAAFTPPTNAFPNPGAGPELKELVVVAGLTPSVIKGQVVQAQIGLISVVGYKPIFSADVPDPESVTVIGGIPAINRGFRQPPIQLSVALSGSVPFFKPIKLSVFGLGLLPTFPFSIGLELGQTVSHPVDDVSLEIAQSISDTGDIALLFDQNIYSAASIADSWELWDISVFVDGADRSSELVDQLSIDAEISSARTAQFTLKLSGVVNPSDWIGKQVEINYIQNTGAVWRRFSGRIQRPEYDVTNKTLLCSCTDELQKVVNGYSNDDLKTLTEGFWHENVFSKDNIGWDYLNDILKTVNKSVHLSSNKQLKVIELQNKAIADHSFDDNLILDSTLSIELTERNQLINKVEITVNSRYQRLFQRNASFYWIYPRTIIDELHNPVRFPTRDEVKEAVEDAGRVLTNAAYTGLWPTGIYFDEAGRIFVFTNNAPNSIRKFSINTAFRWNQEVTEEIILTIISPESVILDGSELVDRQSASIEFETTLPDWEEVDNQFIFEPGLIPDGAGNLRKNDSSDVIVDELLEVMIARASTTILQSHAKNKVLFQLPLSPYIELGDTVSVNTGDVISKGLISKFTEEYDFNRGTPITNIETSISLGGSGLDIVDNTFSAPTRLPLSEGDDVQNGIFLDTHIGGLASSPPEDPDMTGIILNVQLKLQPPYKEGIKIPFDAVDDSDRLNSVEPLDFELKIAVPDNQLIITA